MLTPQDIKGKTFDKATFGGYDMGMVDDFLERLAEDYAGLYKENAVLKGKLKVLVEKVEEYRSTEDSMRMALVTAQKMGSEIVDQARAKGDAMLAEVNEVAKRRSVELKKKLEEEEARLVAAEQKTSAFSQKVLQLIEEESTFIRRLGELVLTSTEAAPPAAAPPPPPAPPKKPPAAPPKAAIPPEGYGDTVADQIVQASFTFPGLAEESPATEAVVPAKKGKKRGSRFSEFDQDQMGIGEPSPGKVSSVLSEEEIRLDIARSISASLGDTEEFAERETTTLWEEDNGEPTTKRPKFNFDDLQFGKNFQSDEEE